MNCVPKKGMHTFECEHTISIKKSVKDSASLEGRVIPVDFVRSPSVQDFIDQIKRDEERKAQVIKLARDISEKYSELLRRLEEDD